MFAKVVIILMIINVLRANLVLPIVFVFQMASANVMMDIKSIKLDFAQDVPRDQFGKIVNVLFPVESIKFMTMEFVNVYVKPGMEF